MAEDEGSKDQRERMLEGSEELPGGSQEYPPTDFNTFVLSLTTSALMNLGMIDDPGSGAKPEVNLPLAKQTIDLIALLEEKTEGNLSGEEERLLEQVLYDLRKKYLDAVSKG